MSTNQCIKQKNISLRVRRNVHYNIFTNDKGQNSLLLDVFVIGTNAHEQLNRFFKTTNIFNQQQNLLKLTGNMEMLELGNANQQTVVDNNGTFELINNQNQVQTAHQLPTSQMSINASHLYRNQQQQQQQQQQHQMRLINNQKISIPRELPVDVPDSFVGIAKQSPRYPPPKPHRQVSPSMPSNNLTTFTHPSANQPYSSNNNVQPYQPVAPPIAQSTAASIVTHNASLRSSIKLKQLEKSRGGQQHGNYPVGQMQAAVNQAFEMNEDESVPVPNPQQSLTVKQQQNVLKVKQSMPDLCSIYNRLQRNLDGDFTDATGDAKLVKLLSIYNTIVKTHDKEFGLPNLTSRYATRINQQGIQEPVTYKVSDLLQSVIFSLREEELTSDAVELLAILCKHEVDGVCSAFDRITQSFEFAKSSQPESPMADNRIRQQPPQYPHRQHQGPNMYPYQQHQINDYHYTSDQVQMDIENNLYQNSLHPLTDIDLSDGTLTKTVRIEKNANQPLGATIKNEEGSVVVGRIICGGAAYNTGLLNEGDELLEVNGVNLRGKNVNDVINILQGIHDTITFKIISRNYKPIQRPPQQIHVKTFFKYDGESDRYIPCKELGLSFERGEILEIIDQSDPKWWQARREGDSEWRLPGLIPSINFLKEREKESNNEDFANAYLKREKKNLVSSLFNCPKGASPRRRKKSTNIPFGPEEIPYYEEVCVHYPIVFCKRPIILVGPKMIGQREIVAKLLQDTSRFASAVSHTSKPMEPHQRDGIDFHFVTRAQFETDIKAGKFVEFGQYQNQYYGTSWEAMKEVVRSKKTCVQLLNTPSIFNFRQGRAGSELKPFFVFVKPDDSHHEKLRNIVASFSQPKSNIDENIKAIMTEVELIETYYLPYFDLVLTVSDVDRAYQQLLREIDKIEKDSQWIPAFWKDTPPS